MMDTEEINKYLIKYLPKIRFEVSRRLGTNKYTKLFEDQDIVQETMILLTELLQDRYDPSISSPDIFISTHLVYCIYKAITYYTRSLYYTGKYYHDEDDIQKRPGTKIVDNSSYKTTFDNWSLVGDNTNKETDSVDLDYESDYHSIDVIHNNISKTKQSFIKPVSPVGNEEKILGEIYCDQVIQEVSKRLTDKQNKIFKMLIQEGENPKFRTGHTSETKHLGAQEIADTIGYARQTVSLHISKIREVVEDVMSELDDV